MTVNLNHYKVNIQTVGRLCERFPMYDDGDMVNCVMMATGMHVLACASFIKMFRKEHKELDRIIEVNKEFYGCTNVIQLETTGE